MMMRIQHHDLQWGNRTDSMFRRRKVRPQIYKESVIQASASYAAGSMKLEGSYTPRNICITNSDDRFQFPQNKVDRDCAIKPWKTVRYLRFAPQPRALLIKDRKLVKFFKIYVHFRLINLIYLEYLESGPMCCCITGAGLRQYSLE